MTKENKALLAALLLGVWIILAVHGTGYYYVKKRMDAARGTGTMTDYTVAERGSKHIRSAAIELGVWVAGVALAKAMLVVSRRRGGAAGGPDERAAGPSGDESPGG